jgi:tight adherence protein C
MTLVVLLLVIALVGVAVWTIVRSRSLPSTRGTEVIDQIGSYGFGSAIDEEVPRHQHLSGVATSLGERFSRRGTAEPDDRDLRSRLVAAGLYDLSPTTFVGFQIIGAIGLFALWAIGSVAAGMPVVLIVIGLALFTFLGWRIPSIVLSRKVQQRQWEIDRALPELIDLLVVSVETGMGFVASLRMTLRELEGPLAQELRLTLQEQTMGLSTIEALQGMAERVQTPAVRAFVRGIQHGDQLGLSLGQILRNLADEMRKRRKALAEERAQKAPVKMLFPLVLLIFPGMFVVLLLPAIISIANTLGG